MSGPVFDKNHDPLGDLTLKMTDDLDPEFDDEKTKNNIILDKNVESVEASYESKEDREVNEMFVVKGKKKAIKKDVEVNDIESIVQDEPVKPRKHRKKRVMTPLALEKLKVAREASLIKRRASALARKEQNEKARVERARKKRADREEKKDNEALAKHEQPVNEVQLKISEPIQEPIRAPTPVNVFGDFDKFCNYMDRYDERKRKKHSTNKQPHPNQKIPE